jgi:site-specific DNA-methyltransferase (adenine-specific)
MNQISDPAFLNPSDETLVTAQGSASYLDSLMLGDCLKRMQYIQRESIDLIYLDPPFFTERKHTLKNRTRNRTFSFDDIWREQASYAEFLYHRLVVMRNLLKPSGSIFVHCDKAANHIVRGVLDEVFGSDAFQSEIIWHYKRWSNAKKGLLPVHQNIYFYSKSPDFKFNKQFDSYSPATNVDQILQKRTRDKHNKSVYARDERGEVKGADAKRGVPLNDVWDIPYLNPKAKERVGYPTQKPLALLERIISLASDEGDIVLDPFAGSGTTCVASKRMNRHYIGIDESPDALALAQERLQNPIKSESALMKKGRHSYEKTDIAILECLAGVDYNVVNRNQGIDAILVELHDESPVLVKVQKQDETIEQAYQLLTKTAKTKRSKRSFLIQTGIDDTFAEAITRNKKVDCQIVLLKTVKVQIAEGLT